MPTDLLASYLVRSKGFVHISLSDLIREEVQRRGGHQINPITTTALAQVSDFFDSYTGLFLFCIDLNRPQVGNELREQEGHDALAKRALVKMKSQPNKDFVITSIRHPSEVEALQKGSATTGASRFLLTFIDAPIQTRYQRYEAPQQPLIKQQQQKKKTLW